MDMGAFETHARQHRQALVVALLLLAGELAVIGTVFKHVIDFDCRANWSAAACGAASGIMVALYCALGALAVHAMLKPQALRTLTARAGERLWPLGLGIAGLAIALLPVSFLHPGSGSATLLPSFVCWGIGMTLILGGMGLYLAPLPRWRTFWGQNWQSLTLVLSTGAAAPWLSVLIRPLWQLDTIADATFSAVAWTVQVLGYQVQFWPETKVIGAGDFFISVDPVCSGVEGMALVTLFVSLYLWLFRADLRFPRAFLLYPLGLMASAAFNVVRITVLLAIGLEGNPALAVGGFHSHAGWLMFTLVALGIVALAQTVPWLRTAAPAHTPTPGHGTDAPLPPFRSDPVVARILPFAIFMLSALLANALSQSPGMIYPARVVLMAGVLALFLPLYARLPWRADPVALIAGAAVGVMWIVIPVPATLLGEDGPPPYGTLTGGLLLAWFVLRGVGTVLLVPVIEELFFRDYLQSRLTLGTGMGWKIVAACITAALFAALHDRWAEAFAAGLAFSFVMARRGNVCDAILAHATANAIVFAAAVIGGNLAII